MVPPWVCGPGSVAAARSGRARGAPGCDPGRPGSARARAAPRRTRVATVPWDPEQFSTAALTRVSGRHRRERLTLVPFSLALMTEEIDTIVGSFAAEPEVHHPVRGRIRGVAAFERFARETN